MTNVSNMLNAAMARLLHGSLNPPDTQASNQNIDGISPMPWLIQTTGAANSAKKVAQHTLRSGCDLTKDVASQPKMSAHRVATRNSTNRSPNVPTTHYAVTPNGALAKGAPRSATLLRIGGSPWLFRQQHASKRCEYHRDHSRNIGIQRKQWRNTSFQPYQ